MGSCLMGVEFQLCQIKKILEIGGIIMAIYVTLTE